MKIFTVFACIISFLFHQPVIQAQNFDVMLEPMEINGLGGIHSFALGQSEGKWLVIGGRLDGLHRRQPFASFDLAGHNTDLIVIDPISLKQWKVSNNMLPVSIREQLSSTNMEFHQDGDILYIVGGYGFSLSANDHITYPYLCAIDVRKTIQAIINMQDIKPFFKQVKDEKLAVTGGYLHKLYDTYYLIGGQRFLGRYNPMGPNNGPGFFQEYTNAIRKFKIKNDSVEFKIAHEEEIYDEENLHRRDFNVVEQIMPNGQFGLTAFSGVFQKNADLPFLTCVNIDSSGYSLQSNFNQYYNHYHCAYLPLYSLKNNQMHTLFFGGIAQYYDDKGSLTKDDNVPFVNTIARVTRTSDAKMAEYKLRTTMPGLLGSGSEFITNESVVKFGNGVINLDVLEEDTTHIGYIFGGISSSAPNIFFSNTGTQSHASKTLFKVYLLKNLTTSTDILNDHSQTGLGMVVYPNPGSGNLRVKFDLTDVSEVYMQVNDIYGKLIEEYSLGRLSSGTHNIELNRLAESTQIIIINLKAGNKTATQKVILTK